MLRVLAVIAVFRIVHGSTKIDCAAGKYSQEEQEHAVTSDNAWEDCTTACANIGMDFTCIPDDSSQAQIEQVITAHSTWIGLSDKEVEGTFTCADGGISTTYSNWNEGEPNDLESEDCVMVYEENGKWNDASCENEFPCLCSTYCIECPAGYYSDEGQSNCTACSAGYYSDEGQSNCTACPAGYYSDEAQSDCTACPVGKYNPNTGQDKCVKCGNGPTENYDPDVTGMTAIEECSCVPGFIGADCGRCAAGKYSQEEEHAVTSENAWEDCTTACANIGMEFTCIPDDSSQAQIEQVITAHSTWIGLSDKEVEGTFTCADGGISTTYSNWNEGEPNDLESEDCVMVYEENGKWNDASCENEFPCLCSTYCIECPAGYYSDEGQSNCTACSAGYYSDEGQSNCTACPAGYYSDEAQSDCTACPVGKYNPNTGQDKCVKCGNGPTENYDPDVTGMTAIEECSCVPGFSGADCDIVECETSLPFISLGLIFIEASYPEALREIGDKSTRLQSVWSTYFYVKTILLSADVNGDDRLSKEELLDGLDSVHVKVSSNSSGSVWANPTSENRGNWYDWNIVWDTADISSILEEAVDIFVETGTFYGYVNSSNTNEPSIQGMLATYPNSAWSEEKCENGLDNGATLTWDITERSNPLFMQCAYVNGILLPSSTFSDALVSGDACTAANESKSCVFEDPDSIIQNNRKRLYCVLSKFCAVGGNCTDSNVDPSLTRMMCKTGLLYDGTPADFLPWHTNDGVKFRWLDTALGESGFRIFRDSVNSIEGGFGQLIADVPVAMRSCGQQFAPTGFTDTEILLNPGSTVRYSIGVAYSLSSQSALNVSSRLFTAPWSSTLSIAVESMSAGEAVSDTILTIQHVDSVSDSVDESFRTLALTTNMAGMASTDITLYLTRVEQLQQWDILHQKFIITPAKCTGVWIDDSYDPSSCDGILHEFTPPETTHVLEHLVESEIIFVDSTSLVIKGLVLLGESINDGSFRSYDEEDWDITTCPTIFGDMCYCPIGDVDINLIVGEDGNTDLVTDDDGYFVSSGVFGNSIALSFIGYEGLEFELWNVSGGTFDDERSLLEFELLDSSLTPNTTFVMNRDSYFVLVAQPRALEVAVLGGDYGIEFISGQRVLVGRDTCGYSKQVVVRNGWVTSDVIATEVEVYIPDDSESGMSVCPNLIYDEPCRVPIPDITSNSSRLVCATSEFEYIDEYFTALGDTARHYVDLLLSSNRSVTLTYVAPLCLQAVFIAPPMESRVLHNLNGCGESSSRIWPPSWSVEYDVVSYDAEFLWEALLINTPIVDEEYEDTVYGKADGIDERAIFCEDDVFSINFTLVEVYPSTLAGLDCDWPEGFTEGDCSTIYYPKDDYESSIVGKVMYTTRHLYLISTPPSSSFDITVTTNDVMSGAGIVTSTFTPEGNETFEYTLMVKPSDPNPFTPFTKMIEVIFEREACPGDSSIYFGRQVVTLGVIPEDVPQINTITTDPTIIFAVLYDPPGGGSTTTLHEGSTLTTEMQIEGMHAADYDHTWTLAISGGFLLNINTMSTGVPVMKAGVSGFTSSTNTRPSVSISRASTQSYQIDFTFDMDISTSDNPEIAGPPSDLILGGGMNLRISKAGEKNRP